MDGAIVALLDLHAEAGRSRHVQGRAEVGSVDADCEVGEEAFGIGKFGVYHNF